MFSASATYHLSSLLWGHEEPLYDPHPFFLVGLIHSSTSTALVIILP
jgi:hypothetical protein